VAAPPAGWLLRTSTRPTLSFLLLLLLCAYVCAFTLEVSHAPISIRVLVLKTLLTGVVDCRLAMAPSGWTAVSLDPAAVASAVVGAASGPGEMILLAAPTHVRAVSPSLVWLPRLHPLLRPSFLNSLNGIMCRGYTDRPSVPAHH
jgi:hypothetical protein